MTLEDEIKFFIDAKSKAKGTPAEKDFEKRMNVLFLEGQMSENAYKILRQIFGYAPVIQETKVVNTSYRGNC